MPARQTWRLPTRRPLPTYRRRNHQRSASDYLSAFLGIGLLTLTGMSWPLWSAIGAESVTVQDVTPTGAATGQWTNIRGGAEVSGAVQLQAGDRFVYTAPLSWNVVQWDHLGEPVRASLRADFSGAGEASTLPDLVLVTSIDGLGASRIVQPDSPASRVRVIVQVSASGAGATAVHLNDLRLHLTTETAN